MSDEKNGILKTLVIFRRGGPTSYWDTQYNIFESLPGQMSPPAGDVQ